MKGHVKNYNKADFAMRISERSQKGLNDGNKTGAEPDYEPGNRYGPGDEMVSAASEGLPPVGLATYKTDRPAASRARFLLHPANLYQ